MYVFRHLQRPHASLDSSTAAALSVVWCCLCATDAVVGSSRETGHPTQEPHSSFHTLSEIIMHPSLVRRQLGGIVPPKVASPTLLVRFLGKRGNSATLTFSLVSSVQTGGQGGSLTPLVDFYSKLPKGPAPQRSFGGLKARYFSGKNASGAPILATILGIFAIGYTIDYQSAFHHMRMRFS